MKLNDLRITIAGILFWISHMSIKCDVYCGNPRDGCYFHQKDADKKMKPKDHEDGLLGVLARLLFSVVALIRAVLNGIAKCRFKFFQNF